MIIKQVVVIRCEPCDIGMASIVGNIHPIKIDDKNGTHRKLEQNGKMKVKAFICLRLVTEVGIADFEMLSISDKVEVSHKQSTVTLDGGREVMVYQRDSIEIELADDGPLLIDVKNTLNEAVKKGFL